MAEDVEAVARIAAGLSSKQQEALLWLPADGSWTPTRAYWKVANQIKWMERRDVPLAEAKIVGQNGAANDLRHRLTPLGQQVRDHLARAQEQNP